MNHDPRNVISFMGRVKANSDYTSSARSKSNPNRSIQALKNAEELGTKILLQLSIFFKQTIKLKNQHS
jgi:hypothetical protein